MGKYATWNWDEINMTTVRENSHTGIYQQKYTGMKKKM